MSNVTKNTFNTMINNKLKTQISKYELSIQKFDEINIEKIFKRHTMLSEIKDINGYKVHKRLNLYVDLGFKCNGNCDFCITKNKERYSEKRKPNLKNQIEALKKFSGIYYSIEFVGGEPLLYSDSIRQMLNVINCKKKVIVTNGVRTHWYNSIDVLKKFDHIDISRHAVEDNENRKIFKSNNLLNIEDYKNMDIKLKEKVRLNVTCFMGKIDSVEKVELFIDVFKSVGINQFMFANLTKLKKDSFHDDELVEFTKKNRISDKKFDSWQRTLINNGYILKKEIIGYAHLVRILEKNGTILVFKSNSEVNSARTLLNYYQKSNYLLELVLAPNGDVFADWNYSQKID